MICPWEMVVVHWTDAFDSENGWIDLTTYQPEAKTVVSIGYVITDLLAGHISLTSSFFPDEHPISKGCGVITHIPVGMIRKLVVMQQPDIDLTTTVVYP